MFSFLILFLAVNVHAFNKSSDILSSGLETEREVRHAEPQQLIHSASKETRQIQKLLINGARVVKRSSSSRTRPKRPSTKKVEDWMSQVTVTTRVTDKDNPLVTETDADGLIVTKPDSTRTSTDQTSSTKLQPSNTLSDQIKSTTRTRSRPKRPSTKKVEDWMTHVTVTTRGTDKDNPTVTETDADGLIVTKPDSTRTSINTEQTSSTKLQPSSTLSDQIKSTTRTRSRPKRPSTKKVEDWMSQATVTTHGTDKDNPTVTENPTEPETDENGNIVTKPDSTSTTTSTEQTSSTELQPLTTVLDQTSTTRTRKTRPTRPTTVDKKEWEQMLNRTRYTTAKTDTTKEQDKDTTHVSSTDRPKTVRTTMNWEDWLTRYEPKNEPSLNPNVTDAVVDVKPDIDMYIYILDEFMKTSSTKSTTSKEPQTSEATSESPTTRSTTDGATATDTPSAPFIPSQPENGTILNTTIDIISTEMTIMVVPSIDDYIYMLDYYLNGPKTTTSTTVRTTSTTRPPTTTTATRFSTTRDEYGDIWVIWERNCGNGFYEFQKSHFSSEKQMLAEETYCESEVDAYSAKLTVQRHWVSNPYKNFQQNLYELNSTHFHWVETKTLCYPPATCNAFEQKRNDISYKPGGWHMKLALPYNKLDGTSDKGGYYLKVYLNKSELVSKNPRLPFAAGMKVLRSHSPSRSHAIHRGIAVLLALAAYALGCTSYHGSIYY